MFLKGIGTMTALRENLLKVKYEQGVLHKFYFRQAQNIHKKLVSPEANYYLKPNDIISHRPTLFGYHEPHLENLFKVVSETNSDFFLDIGANIGLSSVFAGPRFDEIHCVEPNLILSKVLDVNLELSGLSHKSQIHRIGLGLENKTEKLYVPRDNFGGAFVAQDNSYDGSNDNLERDLSQYIVQDIELKEAQYWLSHLLTSNSGWENGLIKIDVEGFEFPIFKAILAVLPSNMTVTIVMENFLKSLSLDEFKSDTHHVQWYGFYKKRRALKTLLFKLFGMSSCNTLVLEDYNHNVSAPHDIIVTS